MMRVHLEHFPLTGRLATFMFSPNVEREKNMNLVQLLHFHDMNRNSFNTLDRRTDLSFMREQHKAQESRNGAYDRYTFSHAAALGCVLAFVEAGVPSTRAASVVSGLFPYIDDLTAQMPESGILPDDQCWLTIVNFEKGGVGFSAGAPAADTFGQGMVISKITINFNAVWRRMANRFGAPIAPENRAEFAKTWRRDESKPAAEVTNG